MESETSKLKKKHSFLHKFFENEIHWSQATCFKQISEIWKIKVTLVITNFFFFVFIRNNFVSYQSSEYFQHEKEIERH